MDFAKIDVKEIKSDLPRSNFSEQEIDQLADLILEGSGVLRPLILKQSGIDSFEVLDGHLEYYASVRAREKQPQQGEMVSAFVVSSKEETAIKKQIQLLRRDEFSGISPSKPPRDDEESSNWISSFETRLSEIREVLFQTKREHEYRFDQIEKHFAEKQQSDLLDMLNTLEKQDLIVQLSRCGLAKVKAEAIYNARDEQEFDSYQDVAKRTKGIGASGILSLIDNWMRIHKPAK